MIRASRPKVGFKPYEVGTYYSDTEHLDIPDHPSPVLRTSTPIGNVGDRVHMCSDNRYRSNKSVKVIRPDVEAAVENLRKAAGSAAVDGLAKMNPGAAALNAGHRPTVNWEKFKNDSVEPEPSRVPAVIDWAQFTTHEYERNNVDVHDGGDGDDEQQSA